MAARAVARGTIWIDVTELLHDFRVRAHPTGVSRMMLNLAEQLIADPGEVFARARLMFWHPLQQRPLAIDVSAHAPLAEFFAGLRARYDEAGMARAGYASLAVRALATSLPRAHRYRLFPADSDALTFCQWAERQGLALPPVAFSPDDSLFVAGSFWLDLHARRLVAQARAAGAPVTAFVHDMILLARPDWRTRAYAGRFRRGCRAILPRCAAIVCNSADTAAELTRLIRLPAGIPITTCRFADRPPVPAPPEAARSCVRDGRYVFCVSSFFPRKNHRLLVRAWRELGRRLGAETPYLILVGSGAPDRRLAAQIARSNREADRIVRLGGVSDGALERLYRGAWLTIYPSLGEGYGLPVAEALARGKVCLAANVEGVREAGAGLIDVIDARAPSSIVEQVCVYLADPSRLVAREAEIRRRYRVTGWDDTARTVRSALEAAAARPAARHAEIVHNQHPG